MEKVKFELLRQYHSKACDKNFSEIITKVRGKGFSKTSNGGCDAHMWRRELILCCQDLLECCS